MNLVLGGDERPFGWWADNVNATQLNRLGTLCTALHGRLDGFDLHAIDFNEYTLSIYGALFGMAKAQGLFGR